MFLDLCVCGVVPRHPARTRVIVVMHHTEAMRQSNTGRLVLSGLEGAEVRLRGLVDKTVNTSGMTDPDRRLWLLFPSAQARPLDRALVEADSRPVTLVVPDGTWNHARKVGLRVPGLRDATHVSLPFERVSEYRLREAGHPHKLSTIEAIARAMELLEGANCRSDLEYLFRVARDRILWSQGKLREDKVTGGLPFREAAQP